jgi:hypothetical protein
LSANIAESQVTSLASDLAGKAASTHTHAESDVTGLVADLAGKQPTSSNLTGYAAIPTNSFALVSQLQSTNTLAANGNLVTVSNTAFAAMPTNGGTFNGNVSNVFDISARHFASGGGSPTIATNIGIGTNCTISLTGKDTAGYITATVVGATTVNASIFTVTFASVFSNAPIVFFVGSESNSVGLATGTQPFVRQGDTTTSNFIAKSGTTAITAGKQYIWKYWTIQQ